MKFRETNKLLLLILLINFCLITSTESSTAIIAKRRSNDKEMTPELISKIYNEFEKESSEITPNTELVGILIM